MRSHAVRLSVRDRGLGRPCPRCRHAALQALQPVADPRAAVLVRLQGANVCRAAPTVSRLPDAQPVYLMFEGLRESRTIADKLTWPQIALPAAQSGRLWAPLAAVLPPDS